MYKIAEELVKIAKSLMANNIVKVYSILSSSYLVIKIYNPSYGTSMTDANKMAELVRNEMQFIIDLLDRNKLIEKENLPDVFALSSDNKLKINITYNLHLGGNHIEDDMNKILDILKKQNFKSVKIAKLLVSDDRWSKENVHNGIKMKLIGTWNDLAGYYEGSDGNAWKYQTSWSNLGPVDEFKANFKNRYRGKLLNAFGFSSQEALDAYMKEHPDANKSNHYVETKKNQKQIEKHVGEHLIKKHNEAKDLAKTPEDARHVYNLDLQGQYAGKGLETDKALNHSLEHFKKQGPDKHQKALNVFNRAKKIAL